MTEGEPIGQLLLYWGLGTALMALVAFGVMELSKILARFLIVVLFVLGSSALYYAVEKGTIGNLGSLLGLAISTGITVGLLAIPLLALSGRLKEGPPPKDRKP